MRVMRVLEARGSQHPAGGPDVPVEGDRVAAQERQIRTPQAANARTMGPRENASVRAALEPARRQPPRPPPAPLGRPCRRSGRTESGPLGHGAASAADPHAHESSPDAGRGSGPLSTMPDDAALEEHRDAVGEVDQLVEVGRDDDDGHAARAERRGCAPGPVAMVLHVQAVRGLVEHDHSAARTRAPAPAAPSGCCRRSACRSTCLPTGSGCRTPR